MLKINLRHEVVRAPVQYLLGSGRTCIICIRNTVFTGCYINDQFMLLKASENTCPLMEFLISILITLLTNLFILLLLLYCIPVYLFGLGLSLMLWMKLYIFIYQNYPDRFPGLIIWLFKIVFNLKTIKIYVYIKKTRIESPFRCCYVEANFSLKTAALCIKSRKYP